MSRLHLTAIPAQVIYGLVLLSLVLLPSCSPQVSITTPAPPTGLPSTPSPASAPAATRTLEPSPTPAVSEVILLAPAGADPQLAGALEAQLSELAQPQGLKVETRAALSPEELERGVKIVVVLPPDPGVLELAAAAPETQFLAVGFPEFEPAQNLSLAGSSGARADQAAFLAGYTAALITPDWRVGVVSPAGEPGGATNLGFGNGVRYYCGLCRPAFPPFPDTGYPLFAELAAGAGEADWQAVVSLFQPWSVQTVYVAPEVASEGLLRALAGTGINLMGQGPAPAGLSEHWIATIGGGDPLQSVREAWPGLLSGAEGQRLTAALSLEEINEDLLSPGRQRLVEEMVAGLAAGYIDTGINGEGNPAD